MIDHVLLDVISALRETLDEALLEPQSVEERFQVDVFLGDVSFETSYSLPGEQHPPRVRADIHLEWPTWSQSSYRSWSLGEPPAERPELIVEVALRLQRLVAPPNTSEVLAAIGSALPVIADQSLDLTGATIEHVFSPDGAEAASAIEVSYQGTYPIDLAVLEEPEVIDAQLIPFVRWIASGLVRLADLELPVLPADDPNTNR
jgi:hypothetical protein